MSAFSITFRNLQTSLLVFNNLKVPVYNPGSMNIQPVYSTIRIQFLFLGRFFAGCKYKILLPSSQCKKKKKTMKNGEEGSDWLLWQLRAKITKPFTHSCSVFNAVYPKLRGDVETM